jgi:hypothetical protein
MRILMAMLAVGIAGGALQAQAAGIYRCTEAGGTVTYQETACAGSSTGGAANIPTTYPDYNVVEHERILRREAMLDARMLERYRIDSAERIARDDRIAREKEAAAQLALAEAMAANAAGGSLFFAPRAAIRHFHRPQRVQRRPLY